MTSEAGELETRRLELFVRSLSPTAFRGQQERVVNRLERLEAVGAIADYSVEVWGDRLAEPDVHRTEAGRRFSERVEAFREWADRCGMSLESFFRTGTVDSKMTDEAYTQVSFPAMTLAEFGSDGLRFVAPCSDGERIFTVGDRLDRIEAASPLQADDEQELSPVEDE